ncbi:hypothetical protein PG988_003299 [Apiospora saccharicola]
MPSNLPAPKATTLTAAPPYPRHHPARVRPQRLVPGDDPAHSALHDLDEDVLLVVDAKHVRLLLGLVVQLEARVGQVPQRRGLGRDGVGLALDLPGKVGLVRPREAAPRRRADRQAALHVAQLAGVRVRGRPAVDGELDEEGAALPAAQAPAAGF